MQSLSRGGPLTLEGAAREVEECEEHSSVSPPIGNNII
jgi:hypothetical protein